MFACQPTFNLLEFKEDKCTEYVIGWKSKEVYTSKLIPLYTVFLHNVRRFKYKIEIQFNKGVLVGEQNNYATKIVNACIMYDSDNWSKNSLNSFKLKTFLFGGIT